MKEGEGYQRHQIEANTVLYSNKKREMIMTTSKRKMANRKLFLGWILIVILMSLYQCHLMSRYHQSKSQIEKIENIFMH